MRLSFRQAAEGLCALQLSGIEGFKNQVIQIQIIHYNIKLEIDGLVKMLSFGCSNKHTNTACSNHLPHDSHCEPAQTLLANHQALAKGFFLPAQRD